jgi:hypothetical protein
VSHLLCSLGITAGDGFVVCGYVCVGEGRSVINALGAYLGSSEAAIITADQSPFGKHDAAAGVLYHRNNKPS